MCRVQNLLGNFQKKFPFFLSNFRSLGIFCTICTNRFKNENLTTDSRYGKIEKELAVFG